MRPASLNLPEKYTSWRPHQWSVVQSAVIGYNTNSAFLADCPTGTGKTLAGVAVGKLLGEKIVYTCTTKNLQHQMAADFPEGRVLKGRGNYVCGKYPHHFPQLTAEHCTKVQGEVCEYVCTYEDAKAEAIRSGLAILNLAYFMAEANFAKGAFSDISFLIADEVDCVEDQLMSAVNLVITQRQLDAMHIPPPKYKGKFESWLEWAGPALDRVRVLHSEVLTEIAMAGSWSTIDVQKIRMAKSLERLRNKLEFFVRNVDQYWVWNPEAERWTFKPVLVSKFGASMLWRHTSKVLGMSATVINDVQLARNVGLPQYGYISTPCPFDKARRPIHSLETANLSHRGLDGELPKLLPQIEKILKMHEGEKGLIHTVSYRVALFIQKNIPNKRLVFHNSQTREAQFNSFRESSAPLVLVSPSMERGVDLPQDDCRFIIVCKVPYPNLGDPQISKRLYSQRDGRTWYAHRTASAIVQMTGRGMRSSTDTCASYILDSQFTRFMSENRQMIPEWWREAIC